MQTKSDEMLAGDPAEEPNTQSEVYHTDSDDGSQQDIDLEGSKDDLVLSDAQEVKELGKRLHSHFMETLQAALSRKLSEDRIRSRPAHYTKINSQKRTTLQSRRKKAEQQEAKLQASGYPDIRQFFSKQQQNSNPLMDLQDEGSADDDLLTLVYSEIEDADGLERAEREASLFPPGLSEERRAIDDEDMLVHEDLEGLEAVQEWVNMGEGVEPFGSHEPESPGVASIELGEGSYRNEEEMRINANANLCELVLT